MIDKNTIHTPPSDEDLMRKLHAGDRNALVSLYARYFNKLVWFARTFVFDLSHAEDIVQEIFIQLIEKPEQFNTSLKFSTWVYTLTANRCKNLLRNTNTRENLKKQIEFATHTEFHSQYDYVKIKEKLKALTLSMNEKERTLFVLRFEHQLPIKEIAELTQIPEGTVKSGIFYMLKKISLHLKSFTNEK